jgi:hypothetical protein
MTITIDTGAIVSAIIFGLGCHAAFMNMSIKKAIAELSEQIAKHYATKERAKELVEIHEREYHHK